MTSPTVSGGRLSLGRDALRHRVGLAITLLCATLLLLGAASSHAALVQYDEAVDGDISDLPPYTQFVLDTAGLNVIKGTTDCCPPFRDDDSFVVTIPAGRFLASLVLEATSGSSAWEILASGSVLLGFIGDNSTPGTTTPFSLSGPFAFPLLPGSYTFFNAAWQDVNGYILTFEVTDVAAVPEPSALALVLAGLALLGVALRRRRSQCC